jgi:uncharacterized protein YukE
MRKRTRPTTRTASGVLTLEHQDRRDETRSYPHPGSVVCRRAHTSTLVSDRQRDRRERTTEQIRCKFQSSNESSLSSHPARGGKREMPEKTSVTDLQSCEQAVMAAAREERAAHAALQEGIKPSDPDWTESNAEAYEARLARWRAASRVLVDALNRAANDRRSKAHNTGKPDARALATN